VSAGPSSLHRVLDGRVVHRELRLVRARRAHRDRRARVPCRCARARRMGRKASGQNGRGHPFVRGNSHYARVALVAGRIHAPGRSAGTVMRVNGHRNQRRCCQNHQRSNLHCLSPSGCRGEKRRGRDAQPARHEPHHAPGPRERRSDHSYL